MNIVNDANEDFESVQLTLKNPEEYARIINKYQRRLLLFIQRLILVNEQDAEDVVQEAFIKAYQNLNSYNSDFKFSSWLYRIAHNEAISFTRNRHFKVKNESAIEEDFFNTIASETDIEKETLIYCTSQQVHRVLEKLDKKYREVLELKYIEEMSYDEMSDVLHIPNGTVGSLVNRAKIKFKELINNNE